MHARRVALAVVLAATLAGGPHSLFEDDVHAAQQELPPVSYICPMDPDVVDDKPGSCPVCKMDLTPVRLDLAWTCPSHPAVVRDAGGACPIDRRELVQVTVAKHWECGPGKDQHFTEPGRCANGSARKLVQAIRAHGDHNPRYGGLFFMAADKWHHLEGTFSSPNVFRVYFYDNFTKPMSARGFAGRVVLEDNGREVATYPLRPSRDGNTLEASVPNAKLPQSLVARLKFDDKSPEQRFDFTFKEYSVAPVAAAPTASAKPAAAPSAKTPPAPAVTSPAPAGAATVTAVAPAATPPAAAPAVPAAPAESPVPPAAPAASSVLPPAPTAADIASCPTTVSRTDVAQLAETLQQSGSSVRVLMNLLSLCDAEVRTLIADSQFGYVYQPTMFSKDVALALETHLNEIPESRRRAATSAVRRVVLAAWLLDAYGDMGNKDKLTDAYNQFAAAVADLKAAYGDK